MAAGASAELVRWETTIADTAFQKDDAQLASNYEDLTAFLSALSSFSVPRPPDSSFTRSLGSVNLRAIRIDAQSTSRCIGSKSLACVPTINVFPYMSPRIRCLQPHTAAHPQPSASRPTQTISNTNTVLSQSVVALCIASIAAVTISKQQIHLNLSLLCVHKYLTRTFVRSFCRLPCTRHLCKQPIKALL